MVYSLHSMKRIREIFTASINLLFPPTCSCGKNMTRSGDRPLCRECFAQLKFIKPPYCSCCGGAFPCDGENHLCGICLKSTWVFDRARSLFSYEKIIAKLIHDLKYSGKTTGLKPLKWASKRSTVLNDLHTPDLIIPVPLHIKRLRKRGFNQALVFTRSLFPGEKKKIKYNILTRKTDTPSQTGLSGRERRINLRNAFVVKKVEEVTGKNILLVDDVYTTGSTANECAKALKAAGCRKIEVLTICRADKIVS